MADHTSLTPGNPVEEEEWPLRDPSTLPADAAGPRLSALISHAPQFPKLPPADALIFGSEKAARRTADSQVRRARQEEVAREGRALGADAAAAGRRRLGGSSMDEDDEKASDLAAGLAVAGGVAEPARPSHRVRFADVGHLGQEATASAMGARELGSSGLYDSDEEGMDDNVVDEDTFTSQARSPDPDEVAGGRGPDETAGLPHDDKALRRHAAQHGLAEEDPLYDPHADEDDEEWIRATVQRRPPQSRQQRTKGPGKTATAAAAAAARAAAQVQAQASPHLSCPACFTPLCFDCQRHSSRPNQFRAMFVTNDVLVDKGRQVRPEVGTEEDGDKQRKFFAALCKTCKTHVAVMDDEEVFHFFNVLESQS